MKGGKRKHTRRHTRKQKQKMWIKNAIKRPGALRRALSIPPGKKIPLSKLHQAVRQTKNKRLQRQARLALTLRKF
jgi:hypothetical protein